MAYLLGSQACLDSLSKDVQDLQWAVNDVFSRTGPVLSYSWKFPDKQAADVDIEDLLDLYDCSEEEDGAEERQVAHIALYELVIDRLILLIHSMSKFVDMQVCSSNHKVSEESVEKGSIGLIVRQFWNEMISLQSWISQTVSERNSANAKLKQFEKEIRKPSIDDDLVERNLTTQTQEAAEMNMNPLRNTSDGNSSEEIELATGYTNQQISKDSNAKACQTYETAFVPCESCDVQQRKMKEAGDIVIKICTDQGLPSSLKKFKGQLTHVEWLSFSDICRWMAEQNKDIARVGKQNELLQHTINPLKDEVKSCKRRTVEAEEKAKSCERSMRQEKETQSVLRKGMEVKMKEQDEKHSQALSEEEQKRKALRTAKEKLELEIVDIRKDLDTQRRSLKELEVDYKMLQEDLEMKQKEAERSGHLSKEVADLKVQLSEVTTQLDQNSKLLAREQSKNRSLNKHTESLQSKQDNLLSRMEALGSENEELSQQVASLEEEKSSFDDLIAGLKVEAKELRKTVKENEIVIKNLSKEKEILEEAIKDTKTSIENLGQKLKEAQERERMIVEYPDLNGPVNTDLQGSGDIAVDMSNQVKANCIRIQVLEDQNQGLEESIRKISSMRGQSAAGHTPPTSKPPMDLIPLWQPHSSALEQTAPTTHHQREFESHRSSRTNRVRAGSPHAVPLQLQNLLLSNQESPSPYNHNHHHHQESSHLKGSSQGAQGQSGVNIKSAKSQPGRPSSAKMQSAMAPVNATSIGAYTQMKRSLGILSTKEKNGAKKGDSHKGRPPSGDRKKVVSLPSMAADGGDRDISTYSCPRCDKMYTKSRDLEIHLSYCTA